MGFFTKEAPELTALKKRLEAAEKNARGAKDQFTQLRNAEIVEDAPKWQYRVEDGPSVALLQSAGDDGWELVSAFAHATPLSTASMHIRYVFKRPIPVKFSETTAYAYERLRDLNLEVSNLQKQIEAL